MQAPAASSGAGVQQMIEYHQYIKSEMFNEVGLSSNFNMKRERLISSEVDLAEDSLFSLVYNMMENRISGIAAMNETFGLNITVDFGSVWALKNKKLVDGITGNNGIPDAVNSEQPPEQGVSAEQDENGKPKTPDTDAQPENGNDNGEPAQNPDAVADSESEKTVAELQTVIDDPDASADDKQAARELLNEIKGKE